MMDLREKIARAICGNWVVGDDRPWQQWAEAADDVIEALNQQEPVAWMCSSEALLRMGYQKFSTTCNGDWNIPVYAGHQSAQAAVPDGWQLVPIEPTSAMTAAFNTAAEALRQSHLLSGSYPASWQSIEAGYRAMLKAAPKAEER